MLGLEELSDDNQIKTINFRKPRVIIFFTVESPGSKISHRIGRLRWQVPALALILVLAHQIIEHTWLIRLPRWQHFISQVLFYGLFCQGL
jgi:hypothetical protein